MLQEYIEVCALYRDFVEDVGLQLDSELLHLTLPHEKIESRRNGISKHTNSKVKLGVRSRSS